jgi:3-carboxy-cis,cis-muconate cycloisomerase
LAKHTAVAAIHTSELVTGLRVDEARATTNLAAADGLLSEQCAMTELTGRAARSDYTGAVDRLIESALSRARRFVKESS